MEKDQIKNTHKRIDFKDYSTSIFTTNKKNKIIEILSDKKVIMIMMILSLIFTSMITFKVFYLKDKVTEYESFFVKIEEKQATQAIIKTEEGIPLEKLKKVAALELVNCINEKISEEEIPDSIKKIIEDINNYYNQSNDYFAFAYKDIYTGFMVSYNENQNIFTASTIKAPTDIYIYEMASKGDISLDEELVYTGNYYSTGSGVLKNKEFNTKYDIRTLLNYSIEHSDNAAHNMLIDRYGRENMLNFWKEKGTNAIFTANNNWGVTNAHDAVIYMSELYNFYIDNKEYGEEAMNNFLIANPKFIKGKNNYQVANKSGWSGTAIHDVSIVFANNPYIVVALSNLGETDYYPNYFYRANNYAYRLHTAYWKYKMDKCGKIIQY